MEVIFPYTTGYSLGYSATQLSTGKGFDFTTNTFVASPVSGVRTLTEGSTYKTGSYRATQTTPSGVWINDDYEIGFHLRSANDMQISYGIVNIYNGSDQTVVPGTGVVSSTSAEITGVVNINMSQILPENPTPHTLGESLGLLRVSAASLPIRENLPARNTVYFSSH